jgi:plasmid stabilization system protein ParE
MPPSWTLAPEAVADLDRVIAHLEATPQSAAKARQRIIAGLDLIVAQPRIGIRVRGAIRQLVLRFGQGGYIIRYHLSGQGVLVTRIWHSRENRPPR